MDDDPVPLIKKRQARHLRPAGRARLGEDEAETPGDGSTDGSRPATPSESPATLAAKLKKKNKLKTRLSFGGEEEEGPAFTVNKSTLSRNLSLRDHPNLTADAGPATPAAAQRPSYSAAELASLKANTPTTALRGKARHPFVLDDDEEGTGSGSGMDEATYEHLMGRVDDMELDGVDRGTPSADDMSIPTQNHIASARERRTAARKLPMLSNPEQPSFNNEEDYISLDVSRPFGERPKETSGPHPESRLMREDDEIGEGDDDAAEYTGAQERIAIGKKAREKEAKKRRADLVEVIDEAEADSDDSESREWELAQVRRAAPARLSPTPDRKRDVYRAPTIPTVTPIPTLAAQQARLSLLLEDLTGRHLQNTKALDGVETEREDVSKNEARVRKEVEEVGIRWGEAKALREWVEALAEFLDVKFPILEKLEDEHISLLSERAGMVNQRRQEDDSDDVALFLGIPRARALSEDQIEITDELGRAPADDSAYSATRRGRRLARMSRRDSRPPRTIHKQNGREEEDGFSTDSDLAPGENADLLAALSDLSERVSSLLSDVRSEEFRDPRKGVGRRFGGWRERSKEEYENAWGGLAAVGAWEFWARLEMAGWNPLHDDRSLDSFEWYDALYQYSRPREEEDDPMEEPPLGPDGDLVSSLVSSAIVPRLCALINGGAFDPYSARHVRRMIEVTEQVEACIGREADKFRLLCRTVLHTFTNEITESLTMIVPLLAEGGKATFDPSAIPARKRYLTRRLKLLSNLVAWRKYAGGGDVDIDRLLGQVMTPIGVAGWEAGGEEVLRRAAAMVPSQLVPARLAARLR
ncbi:hypothetical protein CALVIDRAFT_549520 [Calocera viscosa TUFC12733]|uniref:GCFC-domain-containing protein n=1 Tax=Calocera viscosa (strain TUFC12733) TaxID=1330018 RepID=A0A167MN23_CALVF|nr:hypothetical protein CALVIDRAFT_549520 [Calocera viscosa TUFC12733]